MKTTITLTGTHEAVEVIWSAMDTVMVEEIEKLTYPKHGFRFTFKTKSEAIEAIKSVNNNLESDYKNDWFDYRPGSSIKIENAIGIIN